MKEKTADIIEKTLSESGDKSVTEICRNLKITPQAFYYHVRKNANLRRVFINRKQEILEKELTVAI